MGRRGRSRTRSFSRSSSGSSSSFSRRKASRHRRRRVRSVSTGSRSSSFSSSTSRSWSSRSSYSSRAAYRSQRRRSPGYHRGSSDRRKFDDKRLEGERTKSRDQQHGNGDRSPPWWQDRNKPWIRGQEPHHRSTKTRTSSRERDRSNSETRRRRRREALRARFEKDSSVSSSKSRSRSKDTEKKSRKSTGLWYKDATTAEGLSGKARSKQERKRKRRSRSGSDAGSHIGNTQQNANDSDNSMQEATRPGRTERSKRGYQKGSSYRSQAHRSRHRSPGRHSENWSSRKDHNSRREKGELEYTNYYYGGSESRGSRLKRTHSRGHDPPSSRARPHWPGPNMDAKAKYIGFGTSSGSTKTRQKEATRQARSKGEMTSEEREKLKEANRKKALTLRKLLEDSKQPHLLDPFAPADDVFKIITKKVAKSRDQVKADSSTRKSRRVEHRADQEWTHDKFNIMLETERRRQERDSERETVVR